MSTIVHTVYTMYYLPAYQLLCCYDVYNAGNTTYLVVFI